MHIAVSRERRGEGHVLLLARNRRMQNDHLHRPTIAGQALEPGNAIDMTQHSDIQRIRSREEVTLTGGASLAAECRPISHDSPAPLGHRRWDRSQVGKPRCIPPATPARTQSCVEHSRRGSGGGEVTAEVRCGRSGTGSGQGFRV